MANLEDVKAQGKKLSEMEELKSLEEAVEKDTSIAIFNKTKNFKIPINLIQSSEGGKYINNNIAIISIDKEFSPELGGILTIGNSEARVGDLVRSTISGALGVVRAFIGGGPGIVSVRTISLPPNEAIVLPEGKGLQTVTLPSGNGYYQTDLLDTTELLYINNKAQHSATWRLMLGNVDSANIRMLRVFGVGNNNSMEAELESITTYKTINNIGENNMIWVVYNNDFIKWITLQGFQGGNW